MLPRLCILLVACLLLATGALSDCPDAYWDCLRLSADDDVLVRSGGGITYGTCFAWKTRTCSACNPRDYSDPVRILWRCNIEVLECQSQCSQYADLEACCGGRGRCGSLVDVDMQRQACGNVLRMGNLAMQ